MDEKKRETVILSDRLSLGGEMAAEIAHEINNPLQSILFNIELLEINLTQKDLQRLACIKDRVIRIRDIVRDLLVFGREQRLDLEPADLNVIIEKSCNGMGHAFTSANIDLRLDIAPKPLITRINKNLFQRVMINLLQNAKDAMEASGKGSYVSVKSELQPGQVAVSISDDGPGIPADIIGRIFDPFFTTKEAGKGTGLGLSICKKMMEGMNGRITVSSPAGKGATFSVFLPHEGVVMDERRGKRVREPDYSMLAAKSVLVASNEPELSEALSEAILSHVSAAETASSGMEALEKMRNKGFDFIFLGLPGADGEEFLAKITESDPSVAGRIIFISDDIECADAAGPPPLAGSRRVTRPFTMEDMLSVMWEMICRSRPGMAHSWPPF